VKSLEGEVEVYAIVCAMTAQPERKDNTSVPTEFAEFSDVFDYSDIA